MKKIITGCLLLLVSTHIYGTHNKELAEKIIANGSIDIEKIKVLKELGLEAKDQKDITRLILKSKKEKIGVLIDAVEVPCKTLTGHTDQIWSLIELNNDTFASGSEDKTIRIWNSINGSCEKILTGHAGRVSVLIILKNGKLVSGSYDEAIKIWNLTNSACEKTLTGHRGNVCSLIELKNSKIASGSFDSTIKIWDLTNDTCEVTLMGHSRRENSIIFKSWVYSLIELKNGKIVSGASDSKIMIWNLTDNHKSFLGKVADVASNVINGISTTDIIDIIDDHKNFISELTDKIWNITNTFCEKELTIYNGSANKLIELKNGKIASASSTIKIWDVDKGICEKTLKHHNEYIDSLIQLDNGELAFGARNSTIKIWDLYDSNPSKTFIGHTDGVSSLIQLKNGKLVSGSWDKTIKIWDIKLLMAALKIRDEGVVFDKLLQLLNNETSLTNMAVDKLYPFIKNDFYDCKINHN